MSFLLVTPVSSCQRIFQTVWNNSCFNCQLQVEIFPSVNELLCIYSHFLQQILEHSLEERHQEIWLNSAIQPIQGYLKKKSHWPPEKKQFVTRVRGQRGIKQIKLFVNVHKICFKTSQYWPSTVIGNSTTPWKSHNQIEAVLPKTGWHNRISLI